MISTEANFLGNLDTLLKWHWEDPVDDFERRRNDLIYSNYQGNRNPFIDHSEWADVIYSEDNREVPPPNEKFTKGVDAVKANPSAFGLYSQADLDEAIEQGIASVKSNPQVHGLVPMETETTATNTPHTTGWYFQPEWGWLWTSSVTFPHVYLSSKEGRQGGWLYFSEGMSPPYYYHYDIKTWMTP